MEVFPEPSDATSHVFNVDDVAVTSGSALVVAGNGGLSVVGGGADRGGLVVGDEERDGFGIFTGFGKTGFAMKEIGFPASSVGRAEARRLRRGGWASRFALVSVAANGVVRATPAGGDARREGRRFSASDADADAQCSEATCPAYVYGASSSYSGAVGTFARATSRDGRRLR